MASVRQRLATSTHLDAEINARDKRQVWGAQMGDLQSLVWNLRAGSRVPNSKGVYPPMGAVVLVTARVRERKIMEHPTANDGSVNTEMAPSIRGAFGNLIDHYYNQVLYVKRDGLQRNLYLRPMGLVHVKNDFEHVLPTGIQTMKIADSAKSNTFVELLRLHKRLEA